MIVMGLDPGFANLGYAVVDVQRVGEVYTHRLLTAGVIRTKPEAKRRKTTESTDLIRRMYDLRARLLSVEYLVPIPGTPARSWTPIVGKTHNKVPAFTDAAYIAAEAMSWGMRGTKSNRSVGMAWGVLVATAAADRKALIEVQPTEVKKLAHGTGSTKDEIQAAVLAQPGYEGLQAILAGLPRTKHEHVCDACAVAIVSLSTDAARLRLQGLRP